MREQMSLLYLPKVRPASSVEEDWDYATADTKTHTHGFHTYPAMMIPQVARRLIRMYGQPGQTLLDPFCGSGTSLVEARLAGLNSYGIDLNPLAVLIARVKTTDLPESAAEGFGWRFVEQFERRIPNKRMPLQNSPSNVPGERGETMTREHIVILEKVGE